MKSRLINYLKTHYRELLILFFLCVISGTFYYQLSKSINPVIYEWGTRNTWFEADIHRVFNNMTDKNSIHDRTSVHPLFSIFTNPIVSILINYFKIWPIAAVRIFTAISSMLWTFLLYILFRLIGLRKIDSFVFTILGVISSASFFWMTVSETYLLGSISILSALILSALAEQKKIAPIWYTITSLITLSLTITNWMAGLLTTFFNNKFKNSLQISLNAWAFTVLIWSFQKYIFPTSRFFMMFYDERKFIKFEEFNKILFRIKGFFINSFIMPKIEFLDYVKSDNGLRMSIQNSSLFSKNIYSNISIILWLFFLLLGLWCFFKTQKKKKFRLVLGFLLIGQLLLHLFYGRETFLYSLNFLPLLIILASFSLNNKNRNFILILASILIVTACISNYQSFIQARNFYDPINFIHNSNISLEP